MVKCQPILFVLAITATERVGPCRNSAICCSVRRRRFRIDTSRRQHTPARPSDIGIITTGNTFHPLWNVSFETGAKLVLFRTETHQIADKKAEHDIESTTAFQK